MYELFYLIEVTPQWYNLIVKDTHYCVGCGSDLETLKGTIYKYVRKYKTEDRVYRALSNLSDGGRVCTTVLEARKKDYLSGKHLVFNDLIRGVVAQALKDNRQDTPYHHAKKKVRTVAPVEQVAARSLPPLNDQPAKKVVGKITPLKVKRITTHSGTLTE